MRTHPSSGGGAPDLVSSTRSCLDVYCFRDPGLYPKAGSSYGHAKVTHGASERVRGHQRENDVPYTYAVYGTARHVANVRSTNPAFRTNPPFHLSGRGN